jgi:hypothetical protein
MLRAQTMDYRAARSRALPPRREVRNDARPLMLDHDRGNGGGRYGETAVRRVARDIIGPPDEKQAVSHEVHEGRLVRRNAVVSYFDWEESIG